MNSNRIKQMFQVRDLARRLLGGKQADPGPALPLEEHKGKMNEARAFSLINTIIKEENLFYLASRPYIATKYSVEDIDGFDIIIPTEDGKLGIQIKSSYEYLMEFQKKRHNIPAVVVNDHKSDVRLKIELSSALRYAHSQLIKGRVQIA